MAETNSNTPTKVCTKCGEELPATTEFFYKKDRGRYGLHSWCKLCFKIYIAPKSAQWQREHPEQAKTAQRTFYQRHKQELCIKSRKNAERHRASMAKWQRKYPEKHAAKQSRRRAMKRGASGSHTGDDVLKQLAAQKGRCWHCGVKLKDGEWHADHLIPLARGGSDAPENIVVACPKCNLSKGTKLPQEWNGRLL